MSFGADGKRGRADSSKQGKTEQPKTKLSGCVTKTDRNQWPMARIVNIYIYIYIYIYIVLTKVILVV